MSDNGDVNTTNDRAGSGQATSGSTQLDLLFDERGLIPVIVQEAATRDVLMLAWMDAEAVERTRTSGQATYWSRSRQEYWVKGETSGHRQRVREMRADCDGDTLLLTVDQTGPACHTGRTTCFDDGLIG